MPRKKAEQVTCCSGECAAPAPAVRAKTPKLKKEPARGPKNKKAAVEATWAAEAWPPKLKDSVTLYNPRDYRGKKAKVIAVGELKTKDSTRRAPEGKVRVTTTDACGAAVQFCVAKADAVPKGVKLKDVLTK